MEAKNIWARIIRQWCQDNFQRFWPKCFWPPSSPDLNVMDFAMWGILARKTCETPHANGDSLKTKRSLKKTWTDLDEKTIRNSCANAHKKLEAVVEAVYKILKPHFNKNDAQNICLLEFVFKIGIP